MRKRFLIALFFELLFQSTTCFALQTYPLMDQHKLDIPISKNHQNRIAVLGDRIAQVFGADGAFDIQSDDEGGQIFLKVVNSKSATSQVITLITESGLTQDLMLKPQAIEFQSILLKPTAAQKIEIPVPIATPSRTQKLGRLMRAMALGQTCTGYALKRLTDVERGFSESFPSLKIFPSVLYQSEREGASAHTIGGTLYDGRVYVIKNEGEQAVTLHALNLMGSQDQAIALSRTHLGGGEEAVLFVITARKGLASTPQEMTPEEAR